LSNFMIEETEHSPADGSREFMRTQRDSISKDFLEEQVPYKGLHATIKDKIVGSICNGDLDQHKEIMPVDFTQLTYKTQLESLAQLYSIILDMNLTTNILTEISFLINLLNAEIIDNLNSVVVVDLLIHEKTHQLHNTPTTATNSSVSTTGGDGIEKQFTYNDSQNVFKNFNNCVYFALETLNYQRYLLASLDASTIRVLLENERLLTLKPQLIEFLRAIHLYKVKLENEERSYGNRGIDENGFGGNFNNKNVFYQQESDTRDNFPSEKSFTAFRKQRDMFYSILR
jgi:codanin-1